MYNFFITAATISGNKGAESMFSALYQNLLKLYPGSHFYLNSYYPVTDKPFQEKMPHLTILSGTPVRLLFLITPLALLYRIFLMLHLPASIFEFEPSIRALSLADIVFDIGGITFSDGREKYLPFNVVTILPAILMKKRVIKCAQAMGPFKNPLNRLFAKALLPRVDQIFARGTQTLKHLQSLSLNNIALSSDIAFAMDTDNVNTKRLEKYMPKTNGRLFGIAPSSVVYKKCLRANIDYVSIMSEFINLLAKKYNMYTVLIPHSIRYGSRHLKNNDLPVIHYIMAHVKNRGHCTVVDEELNGAEFRILINHCDLFLASRFHSMISALAVGTPFIVCGWGHKYFELLEGFELLEYAFDYRSLTIELLLSKLELLIKNEVAIAERINTRLPHIRRLAFEHFETVNRLLNRPSPGLIPPGKGPAEGLRLKSM